MVRAAILADSPTLTTGFARTTGHIASALARAGHQVTVFGLKARPDDVSSKTLPYAVWPAEQGGHWTATLPGFFVSAEPDVLIMNMDAFNALECLEACVASGWCGPTVSYVCFDGLPIAEPFLDVQRRCAAVWATSATGGEYLTANGVDVSGVATPGVDLTVFSARPGREALRERLGLESATVVGVFATNTERKQVARILEGFGLAVKRAPKAHLRLYLHCAPGGEWPLYAQAAKAGLADRVLFAGDAKFDERRGLPPVDYVDRLNMCDLVANVPHSGDIEQVILEAQACGIPLLHTFDDGVMSEAFGDAALGLPAAQFVTGRAGQRLHLVAAETIADGIVRLAHDDSLREDLRVAGLANAARYGWDILEHAATQMIAPFLAQGTH